MRRVIIRNKSGAELGVMLEPSTDREDIEADGQLIVEGDLSDNGLIIDFGDDSFLSIWCPPGCTLRRA